MRGLILLLRKHRYDYTSTFRYIYTTIQA